jgi:DNA-binding transcriptional MocR family regulator
LISGGNRSWRKQKNYSSAAKWAEKLGVSQGKVKKAIDTLEIEPDHKKGKCNYYSEATMEKVKNSLS